MMLIVIIWMIIVMMVIIVVMMILVHICDDDCDYCGTHGDRNEEIIMCSFKQNNILL